MINNRANRYILAADIILVPIDSISLSNMSWHWLDITISFMLFRLPFFIPDDGLMAAVGDASEGSSKVVGSKPKAFSISEGNFRFSIYFIA